MMYDSTPLVSGRSSKKRGSCVKKYWLDWLIIAIFGGIALFAFLRPPISKRLFAVTYSGNNQSYPNAYTIPLNTEDDYPVRTEILPTWLSGVIAAVSGLIVIGLAQIWTRSFKDFHRGCLGLANALIGASWFQVLLKLFFGGFRPNFLAVCKPDLSKPGVGYFGTYYDRDSCTGDKVLVNDALESFPSGHSTVALAGMIYLALYLNAKLKLWGNAYGASWKMFVVYFPVLAAALMSLSRLVDYTHHWYDILAGAIIGTVFAFTAYRMQFRSIWDPSTNHLLLPRKLKEYGDNYKFNNSHGIRSSGIVQQGP